MMAAAGAIAAQQPPEVAKDVAAFAAAANLMTSMVGLYFTLYISLPFTVWAYNLLEPVIGRTTKASIHTSKPIDASQEDETPQLSKVGYLLAWVLVGTFALAGNWITYKTAPDAAVLGGMAIVVGVVLAGYGLHLLARSKIPAVVCVPLVGSPHLPQFSHGSSRRRADRKDQLPGLGHADPGLRRTVDRQRRASFSPP